MAQFEKFRFKSLAELQSRIAELGVEIPLSEDFHVLGQPVKVGKKESPNALAVLPMEGCDSLPDGSPSDLVIRRYKRFAGGGAGLLWMEACAVVEEGKANPLQMQLTRDNLNQFKALQEMMRKEAQDKHGHTPLSVLQLTHSGRYSRPHGNKPVPMIAQHDPLLDPRVGLDEHSPVVSDDYLDDLQDKYVQSALLAQEAGFDGVDVKACHRYLISELLASHTREGKYGGSFENRTRFLREVVQKIRKATRSDFIVASRFNVFDAHPYPYGFGVDKQNLWTIDLDDPLQLVRDLVSSGVDLLSNSSGNPYFRFPQVTRPFDTPTVGGETPEEHPLESIARLFSLSAKIKEAAGDIPVVGNGYSWLRQFIPYAGAANIAQGRISFIGMGRESFAYPDAPGDILSKGKMDPKKVCIACSMCTQLMRDHSKAGCVIRDAEIYGPMYKEARAEASK